MADYQPTLDANNALISVEQAKAMLGAKVTDEAQETIIVFCINSASELCNSITGRLLKSRNNTEYYSGDGSDTLIIPNCPITTLSHLYLDDNQAFGADTEISTTYLRVIPNDTRNRIVYYNGSFTPGVKNVKVVYTGGYTDIPSDLQMACMELTGLEWVQFQERRFGVTSRSLGDGSVMFYGQEIPKRVMEILKRYMGA